MTNHSLFTKLTTPYVWERSDLHHRPQEPIYGGHVLGGFEEAIVVAQAEPSPTLWTNRSQGMSSSMVSYESRPVCLAETRALPTETYRLTFSLIALPRYLKSSSRAFSPLPSISPTSLSCMSRAPSARVAGDGSRRLGSCTAWAWPTRTLPGSHRG